MLVAVVLVTQMQGGQVVGQATGFFYQNDGRVYLVTNRHVVRDEAKGHLPDTLPWRCAPCNGSECLRRAFSGEPDVFSWRQSSPRDERKSRFYEAQDYMGKDRRWNGVDGITDFFRGYSVRDVKCRVAHRGRRVARVRGRVVRIPD